MLGAAVVLHLVLQLMEDTEASVPNCIPRKTVKYQTGNINTFMKKELSNVSTLLVNEEANTLFVGGRDAVFREITRCIDNLARSIGYNTSSDLPGKVLQFVRDHPLMDASVNPIGDRPVLLRRGSNCTRIVVDRVTGLDKQTYYVMFLGTDDGYLHKAFSCDGEMFIVEELQLFQSPQPAQSLQLSSEKGMLHVGSLSQVVQLPISQCHQYKFCLDCVLARDPHCAWLSLPTAASCWRARLGVGRI
ncbi:semaphorin-4D-like [Porphyrio hochstetteri]